MDRRLLAINTDNGFGDAEEALRAAKRAGFDGFFGDMDNGADTMVRLGRVAQEEDMIFQSIHAKFDRINHMWQKSELTEDVVNEQIATVRLCAELDVPLMIIHPYIGFGRYEPTEFGVESFSKVVRVAEECGVNLGFENVEGEPYLERIFKGLGASPRVGFCWDTGHELCYNLGRDVVKKYANGKLFGTHFNDNLGCLNPPEITWLDDAHMLPYDGIVDWKGVMRRIKREKYEGIITFELIGYNRPDRHTHDGYAGWDVYEFMRQAYARALKILQEE